MTKPIPLSLAELVLIFIRTGSMAFGGGGATLAMLHSEFCLRRAVLSDEEFQLLFGLSRIVPGMNLLSLTVLLGYRSHGIVGSLLALVGLTVPSFAIILLGCYYLRDSHPSAYLSGALRGLGIAAAALLVHTGWQLCQGALVSQGKRQRALWILLVTGATLLAFDNRLSPSWIILGGGALGVFLSRWARDGA